MKLFHSFVALSSLSRTFSTLLWKTHDISSLLVEEKKGVIYHDANGKEEVLEKLIKKGGANSVKIRLWVDPPNGEYNLTYGLRLAQRAKASGLGIILNLHYSDTWADPGHQIKPKAWEKLSNEQLIAKVKSYTTSVLDAFASQNLEVQMVSIGNEVRAGLLWPNGKYDQMSTISKILTAGVQGVKASKSAGKTKVMIHLDRGYSWSTQEWFYDSIIKNGFSMASIDVQGISYYPFWDAKESTLENFKDNMNKMAKKYGKPIVVAETDWPTKCSKAADNIPASLRSIPFSPEGQTQWVRKVVDIVKGVPNGLGQGVMYWEPGWIDNASLGSKCESSVLFDGSWGNGKAVAKAHSSINMFVSI